MKCLRNVVYGSLCLLLVTFSIRDVRAQERITTFILLRHAEKSVDGTENPALASIGQERAGRLAALLQHQPIHAVYSTDSKRTISTVKPIAEKRNLSIQLYKPFKDDEIQKMVNENRGGTVLVVGHSNSIPWTVNILTGSSEYKDLADNEYDKLFIVDVAEKGVRAKVTVLSF
jgi:2,3-bisphosphoglycerate-dependent phosphoglycerate mutase